VRPALLKLALEARELASAMQDPNFEAIARARFRLPLDLAAETSDVASPALALLRLYIALLPDSGSPSANVPREIFDLPAGPGVEPEDVTLRRLNSLLTKNPGALLKKLEEPQFAWLLNINGFAAELRTRIVNVRRSPAK
jgi:hypothetical protein